MIANRIIAHRGASSLAPENTLAATNLAAEMGVSWIEVDMRLLHDGTPVIFHDRTLERCTNGRGPLRALNVAQLRALDAGSWFGPCFAGEHVPLAYELLQTCHNYGLGVNLELKREQDEPASEIIAALTAILATTELAAERLLVSSFDPALLLACRHAFVPSPLGLLVEKVPADVVRRARAVGAASVHCDWRALTPAQAHAVKQGRLELYCYTVNDSAAVEAHWRWGMDGLITDYPQDFLTTGRFSPQSDDC